MRSLQRRPHTPHLHSPRPCRPLHSSPQSDLYLDLTEPPTKPPKSTKTSKPPPPSHPVPPPSPSPLPVKPSGSKPAPMGSKPSPILSKSRHRPPSAKGKVAPATTPLQPKATSPASSGTTAPLTMHAPGDSGRGAPGYTYHNPDPDPDSDSDCTRRSRTRSGWQRSARRAARASRVGPRAALRARRRSP